MNKIELIKNIRKATGAGLVDSKFAVEYASFQEDDALEVVSQKTALAIVIALALNSGVITQKCGTIYRNGGVVNQLSMCSGKIVILYSEEVSVVPSPIKESLL